LTAVTVIDYPEDEKRLRLKYTGEVSNGMIHGQGTLLWRDGSRYDGEFRNDKLNG
jgi:hypothetical protein